MKRLSPPVLTLLAFHAVALCVLGFYSTTAAAPQGQPPFVDAAEQRGEMIQQLKEIKELLREQNALLRSSAGKAVNHEASPRR